MEQGIVDLSGVLHAVLDEADEMLTRGFQVHCSRELKRCGPEAAVGCKIFGQRFAVVLYLCHPWGRTVRCVRALCEK